MAHEPLLTLFLLGLLGFFGFISANVAATDRRPEQLFLPEIGILLLLAPLSQSHQAKFRLNGLF